MTNELPMMIRSLEVRRVLWGDKKGNLEGEVTFDNIHGRVTLKLDDEHIASIFELCASAIIATANEVASAMIAPVIEHKKQRILSAGE